jgi:hypothetical protein
MAAATLSGVRPPASITRRPDGAPSASDQSNTCPEPGVGESTRMMSAPQSSAWRSESEPAGNAWMSTSTRSFTNRASSGDS